jgi:hypothetical protein
MLKLKNDGVTTLSANINSTVTRIEVTDGSVFPELVYAGDWFPLTLIKGSNVERMRVTARTGNTLTVIRKEEGTNAQPWVTGDNCTLSVTAGALDELNPPSNVIDPANTSDTVSGSAVATAIKYKAEMVVGKNLFDHTNTLIDFWMFTDGTTSPSTNYQVTDYMLVDQGETYSWSGAYARYTLFDVNKNVVLEGYDGGWTTDEIVIPYSVHYIRLTIGAGDQSNRQFEKGSVATDLAEYTEKISIANLPDAAINLATEQVVDPNNTVNPVSGSAVHNYYMETIEIGKNLADPSRVLSSHYLTNTGELVKNATLQVFDYIAVEEGEVLSINKDYRFTAYFDSDKNIVAGGHSVNYSQASITTPFGVSFIRYSVNQSNNLAETYQIEKSETSTSFELYKESIPFARLPNNLLTLIGGEPATVVVVEEGEDPLGFNNVARFDTFQVVNAGATLDTSGVGALLTITDNTFYTLTNIDDAAPVGSEYEVAVKYVLEDLNCESMSLKMQTYFSGNVGTLNDIESSMVGVESTYSFNVTSTSASNFNITPICNGDAIDTNLGYLAKIRIVSVMVVVRDLALQNVYKLNEVFGFLPEGKIALTSTQLSLYNKFTSSDVFLKYNLLKLKNSETALIGTGKEGAISDSHVAYDFSLGVKVDSPASGFDGYYYYTFSFVINSFNADAMSIRVRGVDDDAFFEYYQRDIGVVQTINSVRKGVFSTSAFLGFEQSRLVSNFESGISNDGNELMASVTLLPSSTVYYSEKPIPVDYHAALFERIGDGSDDYLIEDFNNLSPKEMKIATFGDSITEHNYIQYLGIEGYIFNIEKYGLRSNVSDKAGGAGSGAANFANYNVLPNDADIVHIMFGTHDMGHATPIGSIGTLDQATYIGAMEVLIQGLLIKYPEKLLTVATPPQRCLGNTDNEWFYQKDAEGFPYRDYIDALILLCNQYGLLCFDMWAGGGSNPFNMSGGRNLFVLDDATDDILLDITGNSTANTDWFTSDFIVVDVLKSYRGSANGYLSEFDTNGDFIRRSTVSKKSLYQIHPSTVTARVSVNKTEIIVDNTPIGVGISRYSFADALYETMPDRIHPNAKTQRLMSALMVPRLKATLDTRSYTADLRGFQSVDAD